MLLIKLAWRNLSRHLNKTILLGSLIMIGISVLFIANAVFEGTNDGLKRTLVGSFTGDAVIAEKSETSYSLFGNEVPIVSEYETVPPLHSHSAVVNKLDQIPEIKAYTSIVSAPAQININGYRKNVPLFGIDPSNYLDVCVDIKITDGDFSGLSNEGVFLNSELASEVETALDRPLKIGEPVSFSMYVGNSFRVRTVPFLGIHEYIGTTEALKRVVLADLVTVRSLANYTLGYSSEESDNTKTDDDLFNMDDLFSADTDVLSDEESGVDLSELEKILADTSDRDALVLTDEGAWSFVLIRAVKGKQSVLMKKLKRMLNDNNFGAELLNWRRAAGSTALILFAVQSLFYIGLGFLGFGVVLVIMNSLVISVLERTNEIGMMRSMGASVKFIQGLFISESMILTILGAFFGILIGFITIVAINYTGVNLQNPLLISLFGDEILHPIISGRGIILNISIALLLGGLSWVYPVSLAIRIQPIAAINKV